jgi:hypothetical protein
MRKPSVKFYPSPDIVLRLDEMSVNLSLSRSELMSYVLDAFVKQDYDRLMLLHDLEI